jgi:hypothetical protein
MGLPERCKLSYLKVLGDREEDEDIRGSRE